ncbi:MAG: transcription antitermination factor NusB [Ruminococcaceae bacterium]|nr:transcription antitermination factor NusB [Oscillospiraceae bacterium]
MNRREARETVFTLLYERNFHESETPELQFGQALELRELPEDAYMRDVYLGVIANMDALDAKIVGCSSGWSIARMSKITRTILRLSTYEMLHRSDIPYNISINEAVELAKKYEDEKAPGFINGILNAIATKEGLKN